MIELVECEAWIQRFFIYGAVALVIQVGCDVVCATTRISKAVEAEQYEYEKQFHDQLDQK